MQFLVERIYLTGEQARHAPVDVKLNILAVIAAGRIALRRADKSPAIAGIAFTAVAFNAGRAQAVKMDACIAFAIGARSLFDAIPRNNGANHMPVDRRKTGNHTVCSGRMGLRTIGRGPEVAKASRTVKVTVCTGAGNGREKDPAVFCTLILNGHLCAVRKRHGHKRAHYTDVTDIGTVRTDKLICQRRYKRVLVPKINGTEFKTRFRIIIEVKTEYRLFACNIPMLHEIVNAAGAVLFKQHVFSFFGNGHAVQNGLTAVSPGEASH